MTDDRVLHMPVRRFFALSRQIPKLQAEETLMTIHAISTAVGGGDGARQFVDALKDQASGIERRPPVAAKVDLAAMGLGGD